KNEGGITMAQDSSATFDSMPRSAIASGCVDLVLGPAEIAAELARIARHPGLRAPRPGEPENSREQSGYQKLLQLLHSVTRAHLGGGLFDRPGSLFAGDDFSGGGIPSERSNSSAGFRDRP